MIPSRWLQNIGNNWNSSYTYSMEQVNGKPLEEFLLNQECLEGE